MWKLDCCFCTLLAKWPIPHGSCLLQLRDGRLQEGNIPGYMGISTDVRNRRLHKERGVSAFDPTG